MPGCHACLPLPLPSAFHPWLHPAARPWYCAEHLSLQLQHPRRCRAGESHRDSCCQPPQHPACVCLAAAAAGEHPAPCRSCSAVLITAGASQELQRKVSTRGTGNKGGECVASRLILAELFSARGVPQSELAGNQMSFPRSAQTPGLALLESAVIPASS